MRRISLFLLLTVFSLVSLVAVIVAGYFVLSAPSSQYSSNWMGQMMGGVGNMVGGTGGPQVQNQAAGYFGVVFVVLIGVAVVGVGGVIYFREYEHRCQKTRLEIADRAS